MITDTPSFPSIVTSYQRVPNAFPCAEPSPYRIAIIGEAPGETEVSYNIPFCGASGNLLNTILDEVGIDRNRCFVGNICQVRPPGNEISRFSWLGEEIQSGILQLSNDLEIFNPNLVVLLGATPLRAARNDLKAKITEWRGSLFNSLGTKPFCFRKVLPSLHPAGVLREFSGRPLLAFDLKRARDEGTTSQLVLPVRELVTSLDADRMAFLLDSWPSGLRCSLDIEGGLSGWPCVSICSKPTLSHTIVWSRYDAFGHAKVLRAFSRLMWRDDVPKVLQNCLYDNFVLSFGFGILIRNIAEDTMLKGWEVYSELPKGLATQASIWTREPFYKFERKSDEHDVLYKYCAKDSAVTLEICQAQDSALALESLRHYRFNLSMLEPLHYMQHRGIRYDKEKANTKRQQAQEEISALGRALDEQAGVPLRGPKGSLVPQRLSKILYEVKKYPPQYAKGENGRRSDRLTTDVEALLTLKRHCPNDSFLDGLLRHRHLEGQIETLSIRTDPDGRVRCGYNVVGTETGRLTCYTSPTGSGANLTTITKSLRDLYLADHLYDFSQCDLEGADGWTVAAHCARLGDPTMLDDYLAGMKPAKIIALMYHFGDVINQLSRTDLKWFHDEIFPIVKKIHGSWLYLGCKRVQHGSSYLMGIPTMVLNILKDSYKESGTPIYMEHSTAKRLQNLFFSRYPGILTWHQWSEAVVRSTGTCTSASGQTRIFFGRRHGKDVKDTVKEFLAHEAQANTTYVTNCAMMNLWNDPENKRWDGTLIVEPLHQVHDALCSQWPRTCREWAQAHLRKWFHNPIRIAGMEITIPFEGTYGPSWGEQPNKL